MSLYVNDMSDHINESDLRIFTAKGNEKKVLVESIKSIKGYTQIPFLLVVYYLLCVLSCGILPIISLYFPKLKFFATSKPSALSTCNLVYVESLFDSKKTFCSVKSSHGVRRFVYRFLTFFLFDDNRVEQCTFNVTTKPGSVLLADLDTKREFRQAVFGNNQIKVPLETNLVKLFLLEVGHPFFLFQIFSFIVWAIDDYYYYAVLIIFFSAFSIFHTIITLRNDRARLKRRFQSNSVDVERFLEMKQFSEPILCSSSELCPGDVIDLAALNQIPADIILLRSECYVNEAILTGESKPILKTSNFTRVNKNHILFNGTSFSKKKPELVGLVAKTGFSTRKGKLILSILYEKSKVSFQFYKDSFKFMGIMFVSACFVFAFSLVRLIIVGVHVKDIILRALDVITIIVPPTLPICLEEGLNSSVKNLKKQGVRTLFPKKVTIAGKVNIMCFDKTGTITDDVLRLKKIVDFGKRENEKWVRCVLGCCHSIAMIDGKLQGDPLEISLFSSSGMVWDSQGSYRLNEELVTALKVFQFESSLQRMSVVTTKGFVFAKGSPEVISQLSIPSSIPQNFVDVLSKYTKKGYRVMACAFKRLVEGTDALNKELLDRSEVESNLIFLGLLVITNEIKPESIETLSVLKNAGIKCVVVTGDNPLTAISVARKCDIIASESIIIIKNEIEVLDDETEEERLVWMDYETNETVGFEDIKESINGNVVFTGSAFRYMRTFEKKLFEQLLPHCSIFARMSPMNKCSLIDDLKKQENVVGMCGDGTNDCSAIKESDCGISVSPSSESSLVSHFSFKESISCVPIVLRESKASLQTSFSIFKFIILYSVIQAVTVCLLYFFNTNLGDVMFLVVDLGIIFPICILVGKSPAKNKLTNRAAESSLMKLHVISSILCQSLMFVVFLLYFFFDMQFQSWFIPIVPSKHIVENRLCHETTILFYVSSLATINIGVAYAVSKPFKQSTFKSNKIFIGVVLVLYISMFVLMGNKMTWLNDFVQVVPIPMEYLLKIMFFTFVHLIGAWCLENFYFADEENKAVKGRPPEKITAGLAKNN